jgi:hypothetical protein
MSHQLQITYEVDQTQCDLPSNDDETFVEHVVRGAVTIFSDVRAFRIWPCGVLRVSRSLVRLCTFPVMYGVEARESVLELDIDFRSTFENGHIILEAIRLGRKQDNLVVQIPPSDALQIVGSFHRNVLLDIFRRCPKVQDENLLLLKIPDAFALAGLMRMGKIGSNPV